MSRVKQVNRDMPNQLSLKEIESLPILPIPERGLDLQVCKHLGIRTALSTEDGKTPIAHYFPYYSKLTGKISGFKKRDLTLPKEHKYHFSVVGDVKTETVQMFGQPACEKGGLKLIVVEGEYDVAAAWQILYENQPKKGHYIPNVVGLPLGSGTNGVNAAQSISNNLDFFTSFKETIATYDNDRAGGDALQKTASLLPTIKVGEFPLGCKDPCDVLKEGKEKEYFKSVIWSAKDYTPAGFVSVDDVWEEATKMPEWGRPWPWPSMTKLTYGRRDGEGIYVGAGVKIGKSSWVNQMLKHIIIDEDLPVAVFKFEETPPMTTRLVAGKVMHKQFHIPDGDFTQDELKEGVSRIKDKLIMFDPHLSHENGKPWDRLKPAITHAVVVEGVKDIFIDPITQLTDGMSPSDTETELRRFSNEIAMMAKDLGFFYYCFCHLKAPTAGKPHEEGGRVHSNQFRGSRAMMEKTHYMAGLQRNKLAEDEIDKDTTTMVLLEDRVFGRTGKVEIYYNPNTGDYLERTEEY